MLKNYFNDDKLFESVYQMNEDCGGGSCGSGKPSGSCGGSGCGFKESMKLHECGSSSYISYSGSSCGGSGYSSSGCGGTHRSGSCEIGRRVRIIIDGSCGGLTEVGRLLGYADD